MKSLFLESGLYIFFFCDILVTCSIKGYSTIEKKFLLYAEFTIG